jgi:hypothetical protein
MRVGCSGCLTLVAILAVAVGVAWSAYGLFQAPDIPVVAARHEDWVSAQQKIFDLFRRGRRRPGPAQTVTLAEREVTALVSRQLAEAARLPVSDVSVRLLPPGGLAEIAGHLPLRAVLAEIPLAATLDWLPAGWALRPVWIVVRLRPRLESRIGSRPYLALDVDRLRIGRRTVPSILLRLILPTEALRYFTIPLPESIEGVSLEHGRLLIRTGS